MKIVFICFYEAYPPVSGAASVTYNVAKYSQGDRTLIQLGHEDRRERTDDGITVITLHDASANKFQKIKGLFGRINRIAETIESISPDVIVLEGASWVVYHWLLLRQIRRKRPTVKVIYHSHNVEYHLRKEKHGKIVMWLTRWTEGGILHQADISFAVSEVDSRHFEELYGVRPELLPNGVEVEKFNRVSDDEIADVKNEHGLGEKTIIFMGSYLYKPNKEAIDFLVKSVMPVVVERCRDAKLLILGGDVPYKENWLISPGCVSYDKVPIFTKACQVGVAPIFSGSGTRLKILEYMAGGLPVVATSKGAEGLKVTHGKDVLIAEDSASFAAGICRLLSDVQLSTSLGKCGREVVVAQYTWRTIMQNVNKALSK